MKAKIYSVLMLMSIVFALAAIGNYLYYYYYPASRPILYYGDDVNVIAYTTVSSKYLVLIPSVNEMSKYSVSITDITIAGYTAPIQKYTIMSYYSVDVAVIPTVFTMASKMTIGSYVLTRGQGDVIQEINSSVSKTRYTIDLFILSILSLVLIPAYSKVLEFYERWKIEREEKEEEEEYDEEYDEDEEEEEEEGEEEEESMSEEEEEYLLQRYKLRSNIKK